MDRFRIKIWDKNNYDAVVYENQMGQDDNSDAATELVDGSVAIRAKYPSAWLLYLCPKRSKPGMEILKSAFIQS